MKKLLPYLLVFVCVTAGAQKFKLALNLKTGETYHYNSVGNVSLIETINGQELNIGTMLSGNLSFKVADIRDSLIYTDAQYTDIGMKLKMGEQTSDFQSNVKDKTDLMSQMLTQMTNKTFKVIFTKTGRVHSVDGIENLVSGIFDKFPDLSEAQKSQAKAQLLQSFGNDSFKGNIEMAAVIFSDKPVEKNGKWLVNTDLNSKIKADILSAYQLTDVTDGYYAIHDDAKITTVKSDKFSEVGGMKVKYVMDGTMTSDIKIDKATGWIIESKMKQVIKGTAVIQDNPQVPGGMTMPMNISSEVNTTGK